MYRAVSVLFVLPLLFAAVLGIGVLIQPVSVMDGNPISVSLTNITDGYSLGTTLTATFPPTTSTSWFNITNWKYSFALQSGNLTVTGKNVNRIMLLVRSGTTFHMAEDTGTGVITVSLPTDILPGVYYDYRILYEVHNASAPVSISLTQQGSKTGPDDSVSIPVIYGANGGNLAVEVRANGTLEGSQGILVGSTPVLPSTPTQGTTVPAGSPPPTVSVTATGTMPPATTTPPVTTTPVQAPSIETTTTVPPATTPVPGPGGIAPFIIGFAVVVIILAILADYFIMRD